MHTSFSRLAAPVLGLGLAGLALAPQSASALGYAPGPPDLKVIQGSAFDNGTQTTVSGNYTFGPNYTPGSPTINGVETDNSSTFLMTGGQNTEDLTTKDNSLATIAGGMLFRIGSEGNSTVDISGGKFQNLYTFGTSTIDLFGTNLTETPDPSFPTAVFDLSGTLSDGTAVNAFYEIGQSAGGKLEFNNQLAAPVPEASTMVSLSLLLMLGLGGMAVAKKKSVKA